jgi:predicted transcriptional regulator
MRVARGKVIGNTVVLEEALPEGSDVTVMVDEAAGVYVDKETEAELAEAIAEADRGELVDAAEVFAALPPRKKTA